MNFDDYLNDVFEYKNRHNYWKGMKHELIRDLIKKDEKFPQYIALAKVCFDQHLQ